MTSVCTHDTVSGTMQLEPADDYLNTLRPVSATIQQEPADDRLPVLVLQTWVGRKLRR